MADELRFRSRAALLFRAIVIVEGGEDGFLVADEGGVEAGEGAVFGGAPLHFGEGEHSGQEHVLEMPGLRYIFGPEVGLNA